MDIFSFILTSVIICYYPFVCFSSQKFVYLQCASGHYVIKNVLIKKKKKLNAVSSLEIYAAI